MLTGADGGIGLATAEYFIQCGVSIAVTTDNNLVTTELTHTLGVSARRFAVRQVDVTNSKSCLGFAGECQEHFESIDCLVHNAAVLRMASTHNLTDDLWREAINSNLDSVSKY